MAAVPNETDWVALTTSPLPFAEVASWAVTPACGALVIFAGTVRDYAEGRPGVSCLEYEAYEDAALGKMREIVAELRQRWPEVGRVALLHRTGLLGPAEISVVVAVTAPHRPAAFTAARHGIDEVKSRVPIWKREVWEGGEAWGLGSHALEAPRAADLSEHGHMSPLGS